MMYYSLFISITGFLIVADPFAEWKDRTSALDAKAEVKITRPMDGADTGVR